MLICYDPYLNLPVNRLNVKGCFKVMNPLLDFSGLPRFEEVRSKHVAPALDQLLAENRELCQRLLADSATPTWNNFIQPLADANERLSRSWGQVSHLNAVMNSAPLREVYNANLPKITQYYAELAQNLALFQKVKAIRSSAEFATLNAARQKIIDNQLRDFRLGGAELPEAQKPVFSPFRRSIPRCARAFPIIFWMPLTLTRG